MKKYEIKFWKNFLEADVIDRQIMITNLPALKEFKDRLTKDEGELVGKAFDMIMFSLFDDLANEAYIHYSK